MKTKTISKTYLRDIEKYKLKIHRKIIEYNYRNGEKDKNRIIPGRQEVEKDRQFKQNYRIIK